MSKKSKLAILLSIIGAIIIVIAICVIVTNIKSEIKIMSFDQTKTISFGYEKANRLYIDEVKSVSFNMNNPQDFIDRKIKNHENLYEVWEMANGKKSYILKFENQVIEVQATEKKVTISNFGHYMNHEFLVLFPGREEYLEDGDVYTWETLNKGFKDPIFTSYEDLKKFYLGFGDLVEVDDENKIIKTKMFQPHSSVYLNRLSTKYWIEMTVDENGIKFKNVYNDYDDPWNF